MRRRSSTLRYAGTTAARKPLLRFFVLKRPSARVASSSLAHWESSAVLQRLPLGPFRADPFQGPQRTKCCKGNCGTGTQIGRA